MRALVTEIPSIFAWPVLENQSLTGRIGTIESFEQQESQIRVSVVGDKAIDESAHRVTDRLLLTLDEIEPVAKI